jgi:ATP-dependent DNA helicase RecQ
VAEDRQSLRTPRQLARFLCGLTSPATSRERLGRHAAFGLLASVPFAAVLTRAESLVGEACCGAAAETGGVVHRVGG